MIKKMYALSNKKDVEEQFARQERRRTLLKRQELQDALTHTDLQAIDASPMLHHSMASQARKNNVFSLPMFLCKHADDPAIDVSLLCVPLVPTYVSSSQIS